VPSTALGFGVGRTCGVLVKLGVVAIVGFDGIPGAMKPLLPYSEDWSTVANCCYGLASWK
jgi:hypothetical protein